MLAETGNRNRSGPFEKLHRNFLDRELAHPRLDRDLRRHNKRVWPQAIQERHQPFPPEKLERTVGIPENLLKQDGRHQHVAHRKEYSKLCIPVNGLPNPQTAS